MSDEGFHSNWPPGYPWIMFKLPFAILIRMALWPCTGGRSVSLGEALQVNLVRWSRSTQTNGSTAVPCCSSGRPCPSVFPVPLGKLTDSKLSSVPCPPPPRAKCLSPPLPRSAGLQDIEEKGGQVSETSRWTPGRDICIQTGPCGSDAHPHLRLRAGDADRQGIELVQQGQKAWAGSSRGAEAAKSQSSGGYMQSGGLPFELENLSLVTGLFGALFLGWNRSALRSPGGVWSAAAPVLPLCGSFFSLRPTGWTNLVL